MRPWTASLVAVLLVASPAVADAQPNCEAIPRGPARTDCYLGLALQLLFWDVSESMGNHDSEVVDASSVD